MGKINKIIKDNYPYVLIMLVSTFAFLGGYLQSTYTNRADAALEQASEYEYNVLRIEQRLRVISNNDANQMLKMLDKDVELAYFALEYSTMSSSLTEPEKEVYRLNFARILAERNGAVWATTNYNIHHDFTQSSSKQEYVICAESTHGFDYIIKRDDWEDYTPLFLQLRSAYYTQLGLFPSFESVVIDLEFYVFYEEQGSNDYLWQFDIPNAAHLIQIPFHEQVKLQLDKTDESIMYRSIADKITIGVSVITIATVLSTAMATAIDSRKSKHKFSVLRADIKKDPSMIEKGTSQFAIVGLILALIIGAFGLLLPIYLTWFF